MVEEFYPVRVLDLGLRLTTTQIITDPKTNPSRCGVITGKQRERAQRIYWQVMFPEGPDFVLEAQLDLIS